MGWQQRYEATRFYRRCGACCAYYTITFEPDEPYVKQDDRKYNKRNGTSFAARHVTGLVALMFQVNPDLTHEDVRDILRGSAIPPAGLTASTDDPRWAAR